MVQPCSDRGTTAECHGCSWANRFWRLELLWAPEWWCTGHLLPALHWRDKCPTLDYLPLEPRSLFQELELRPFPYCDISIGLWLINNNGLLLLQHKQCVELRRNLFAVISLAHHLEACLFSLTTEAASNHVQQLLWPLAPSSLLLFFFIHVRLILEIQWKNSWGTIVMTIAMIKQTKE